MGWGIRVDQFSVYPPRMGIFASNGRIEKNLPVGIDVVRTAIAKVAAEQQHHLGTVSPDGSRYEINSRRTALNWGTALALTLSAAGTGTQLVVDYDNVTGSPSALLDGRKNTKTANQFIAQLEAAL